MCTLVQTEREYECQWCKCTALNPLRDRSHQLRPWKRRNIYGELQQRLWHMRTHKYTKPQPVHLLFWPLSLRGWVMRSVSVIEGGWENGEREKKGERWRHRHLIFPPCGSSSCCSPSLAITFHCQSCLQSPLPTRAALPSERFLPSLLHPHKWLSETGQVLQTSPRSSTCLIRGPAHCTKTSNTLPTHWGSSSLPLKHTHW